MRTEGTRIIALALGIAAFGCEVEDTLPDPSEEARMRREAYEDQLEDIRNQPRAEQDAESTGGLDGGESDAGTWAPLEDGAPSPSADAGAAPDAQASTENDATVGQEPDGGSNEQEPNDAAVEQEPEDAAPEQDAETDASEDAGETDVSFARVYEILQGPCSGCHGAGKKLDLSTATTAYAEMIDAAAEYGSCLGQGGIIVVPYDADGSLLIQKLEGTQTCGVPMPIAAPMFDQALIDEIRSWIDDGAFGP